MPNNKQGLDEAIQRLGTTHKTLKTRLSPPVKATRAVVRAFGAKPPKKRR